jgi:serine/threonine protein kinase
MGTTIYMSPESMRGELSYKVDSFAFGLVIIEALTGLPFLHSAAGLSNLHTMFEEDMDTAEEFLKHLDTRARWEPHTSERIPLLHRIAQRCLVPRPKRRAGVIHSIEDHLKRSNRRPLCGLQLKSKTLMPNFALRQAVEAYLSERGQAPVLSAPEHRA